MKFLGSFESLSLEKIDKNLIVSLLAKNVIIKKEGKQHDSEFLNNRINYKFNFEDSVYELNQEFLDEAYSIFSLYVESRAINYKLFDFRYGMSAYIDNEDKLKYLKEVYAELIKSASIEYRFFIEHYDLSWKEVVKDELVSSIPVIECYLKYKGSVYNKDVYTAEAFEGQLSSLRHYNDQIDKFHTFLNRWYTHLNRKKILSEIENKIDELSADRKNDPQKEKPKTKYRSLSEIFKNKNGLDLFKEQLLKEEVITKENQLIIDSSNEKLLSSAICFLLSKSNEIDHNTDKELISAINEYFSLNICLSTYSGHKKRFNRYYPDRISYEEHLDRLHFIK